MAKAFGKTKWNFGNLFMKIVEIRRKWRWKVTRCMWGGKWRENNGEMETCLIKRLLRINWKAFVGSTYFQFSFGALFIIISLSLSLTLGHLEFLGAFWHWTKKTKKEGKRRKQARRSRNQETIAGFLAGIDFHVWFPC